MSAKKKPNFIQIPYAVLYNRELSDFEKLLFGQIHSLTKQSGYCYATNEQLGNFLNKSSKSTVSKAIKKLTDCGFIYSEISIAKRRKLYVIQEALKDFDHSKVFEKNSPDSMENHTSYDEKSVEPSMKNQSYNKESNKQSNKEINKEERRMRNSSLINSLDELTNRLNFYYLDLNLVDIPEFFDVDNFIKLSLGLIEDMTASPKIYENLSANNVYDYTLSFVDNIKSAKDMDFIKKDIEKFLISVIVQGQDENKIADNDVLELEDKFSLTDPDTYQFIWNLYTKLASKYIEYS